MCGLAINIASFVHLLKRVEFDAIVDHLALVHILKSKTEPSTTRIKRLLEVLSAYSFNLYYMKGKDKILSDFLSRQRIDRSNPHEIIPISFYMKAILKDKYYNVGKKSKYLVETCPQIKDRGIKLPEVHRAGVNPDLKPERIVQKSQKLVFVTLNGAIVQLPISVKVPFRDKYRLTHLITNRSLLLHIMVRQGTSWYALVNIEYLLPLTRLEESEL